jgi:hypothetical protein
VSGLEQVRALEAAQRLVEAHTEWVAFHADPDWRVTARAWETFSAAEEAFEDRALDLARLVLSLSAENAALASENAVLRAQAQAVAGVLPKWDETIRMLRANVPEDMEQRNARDFHSLGRAGGLTDCADDLEAALAQASAGQGEGGTGG